MPRLARIITFPEPFFISSPWAAKHPFGRISFAIPNTSSSPLISSSNHGFWCLRLEATARFEHVLDLQALRLSAELCRLSQCIPPRLWALCSFNALDAEKKVVFYLSDEIFAIRAPSWSPLMREVQPSSKSSWLQIAPPRTWESILINRSSEELSRLSTRRHGLRPCAESRELPEICDSQCVSHVLAERSEANSIFEDGCTSRINGDQDGARMAKSHR